MFLECSNRTWEKNLNIALLLCTVDTRRYTLPFIRYLHFILASIPGSSTLGYFRQINASLPAFKHSRSWIFSSGPDQWPVRTLLRGHPGGHRGANQALAQGSLVIMMQGVFSLPSAEARQHDTGHRLVTHSLQLLALYNFKTAAFKKGGDFSLSRSGAVPTLKWSGSRWKTETFPLHKRFVTTSVNSIRPELQWGVGCSTLFHR